VAAAVLQALHLSSEGHYVGTQAVEVSITHHVKLVLMGKLDLLLAAYLLFDLAFLDQAASIP
jgi:hypothetical protein